MRLLWLKISTSAAEHAREGALDPADSRHETAPDPISWQGDAGELTAANAQSDEESTTRAFFTPRVVPPSATVSEGVRGAASVAAPAQKPIPDRALGNRQR